MTPLTIITTGISVEGISFDALLGGSVDVSDGDISRQLSIEGLGDFGTVDPGTDSDVTVVWNDSNGNEDVPVFVGPIVRVRRSGDRFALVANDRAHYGLAPYRIMEPFTIAPGTKLGDAINTIASYMGQTTDVSDPRRLKVPLSVERGAEPWRVIKDLCRAASREIHFDSGGNLVWRRRRRTSSAIDWTVSNTELLSDPQVAWDTSAYRTAAEVVGNLPCGEVLYSLAGAADASGRWAVERIETEDVVDQSDADALADDTLDDFDITDVNAEFDAIAHPTLQVGDKVSVASKAFRVTKFTIPLNGTGSMCVGAHKRVHKPTWKGFRG